LLIANNLNSSLVKLIWFTRTPCISVFSVSTFITLDLVFMWVMYNPELHTYELLYELLHRSNRARCNERWSRSNMTIYILMMQFPICKISLLVWCLPNSSVVLRLMFRLKPTNSIFLCCILSMSTWEVTLQNITFRATFPLMMQYLESS